MDLLKEVKEAWGWSGVEPVEIVTENDFGNLILKDKNPQNRKWIMKTHLS